jgi:4-hydroxy-3-methylbut-2-enyl diphosphate reductase
LAEAGGSILLSGVAGLAEVVGTMGEAQGAILLVQPTDDVDQIVLDPAQPVAWLSQTTLSVAETQAIVERLRQRFPDLIDPPSSDICYATQNRQAAVQAIASDCQLVIVVGSANSSNSVRLVEVARTAGAGRAERVSDASEIDSAWLTGVTTVGVTSGASVPESLVEAVVERLGQAGFGEVVSCPLVQETLTFALPPELRRGRSQSVSATAANPTSAD